MSSGNHAYAQARLQARFGAQPGASVWESLQTLVELPTLLEQMRVTPLRHWIASISASTPPHEMERLLRRRMQALIDEVAHWLPAEWRAAVRWTGTLLDLPALAHLLRDGETYAWMQDEPALQELAALDPSLRAGAVARGRYASLLPRAGDTTLIARWLLEWRRRWPDAGRRERAGLEQLVARVRGHLERLVADRNGSGWASRNRLRTELTFLFRREARTPTAAFAWLLLAALELERVRGALIERAHFAPGGH